MVSRRRARLHAEQGATTLEMTGVILLVAVVVGALAVAILRSDPVLQAKVEHAICVITSGGEADCGEAPGEIRLPEDHVPPEECVLTGSGESTAAGVSLVVTLESGESWLIEELGNGQYRLTRATSVDFGAGVGVGFDVSVVVDDHTYGAALYAKADAMVAAEEGDVFYADSLETAQTILRHQQTADTKESWLGPLAGPTDWVGENTPLWGAPGEYENLAPDEWWVENRLELGASAGATALYESAEVEAAVDAYLGTTERTDGTSTDHFGVTASAAGGVELWGGGGASTQAVAEAEAGADIVVEFDRDADGNIVAMRVGSTLMAHADAGWRDDLDVPTFTETTMQIPVETDRDRQVAHNLMAALGVPYTPGISDEFTATAPGAASPAEIAAATAAFAGVAGDEGYIYEQEYALDTSTDLGVTFDAKAIVELGFSGEEVLSQQELVNYRYWNGTEFVQREGCVA